LPVHAPTSGVDPMYITPGLLRQREPMELVGATARRGAWDRLPL
jgi:hypothetical protein